MQSKSTPKHTGHQFPPTQTGHPKGGKRKQGDTQRNTDKGPHEGRNEKTGR
jgi:hypothetical protein